jgi:RNA polymerase sigma-70 factor (ECF subfamily)
MVGHEDAYDITQEVFIKALRAADSFRGESSFRTWIFTIARHTCFNHCRDRRRKQLYEEALSESADDGDYGDQVPDPDMNVERIAETRELQDLVGRLMLKLTPEQRMLIGLRDFEGLQYEEIAEIADLSVGNLKSKLHRARIALRKQLEPYWQMVFGTEEQTDMRQIAERGKCR